MMESSTYVYSALRNSTSLKYLIIHDHLSVPSSRKREHGNIKFTSFSSMERVTLPDKTTCTDFLLEINNILKENSTLEEIDIRSGLFLPLSAEGHRAYHQWTGLGPLQQFNVRAVGSGRSPKLRKSFSSSDLTQSQTLLFWNQQLYNHRESDREIDFKELFFIKKREGKKLFSLHSFTAPDTEVMQSFASLDPHLKQCLRLSQWNNECVGWLKRTYCTVLGEVSRHLYFH